MNSEFDFSLNQKNWNDLSIDKYEKDFTFVVDGKQYSTPRFVADILSPKIRKLHFTDESINELHITTDNQTTDDHFTDFLNLCFIDNQKLDTTLQTLYSIYFLELGNIDEYFRLQSSFFGPLSTENCVSLLLTIEKVYSQNLEDFSIENDRIKEIMSFISQHFDEISTEEKKRIKKEDIEEIISKDTLKIKDEDSLLDFVQNLYEEDHSYSYLFSKIIFNNVTEQALKKFITIFSFEDIDFEIWNSICNRLLRTNDRPFKKGRYITSQSDDKGFKEFNATEGHEFEGIMRYLTRQTGGNIHDNGTIKITSNSIRSVSHPKNLVDYENSNFYESNNESEIFICFDFKDRRVQLSDYSIMSHSYGPNCGNLRNWVIEVSNDRTFWEEVDRHSNDTTLNNSNITAVFHVNEKSNEFYRYIRLRTTGCSWYNFPSSNYNYIYFYFIEFFGKLDEPLNK